MAPTVSPEETKVHTRVWYKGEVCVNLVGTWAEPLWIITNLEAEPGRKIHCSRMNLDETFRDLKSLLDMSNPMNKQQVSMEKMLAWLLIVLTIGLLIGEG